MPCISCNLLNIFLSSQNAEATLEQKKAERNLLKLNEEHKVFFNYIFCSPVAFMLIFLQFNLQKEKEELHKKIIELQKELDAKQALELEIQRLRGAEQVMKHMEQDGDEQAKNELLDIQSKLKEKEEELENIGETTNHLINKERSSNDEIQGARKKLFEVRTSYHFFPKEISM